MKQRKPFLAFLLSFLMPGLGQMYNGQLGKGIIFAIIIPLIYLFISIMGLASEFYGLVFLPLLGISYKLYVCIEAHRTAQKLNPYQLKAVNALWKYAVFTLIGLGLFWVCMENSAYQAFSIPTPSMEPSIQVGDKVMATSFDIEKIQLGDVVVFQAEDGGSYLGRVMGLPNQQIAIKNHRAVYGQEAEKWLKKGLLEKDENIFYQGYEYQKYESTLPNGRKFTIRKDIKYNRQELKPGHSANMEAQVVPAGRVFILGDNRTNSVDSRMYGTIALNQIKKRINYIWWSRDKGRIGLQLNK